MFLQNVMTHAKLVMLPKKEIKVIVFHVIQIIYYINQQIVFHVKKMVYMLIMNN